MKVLIISILLTISFSTTAFGNLCPICPFCIDTFIEEQSVFESESFNILVDYMPRVKGQLLVVPKRHVLKAHELTPQEWQELSVIIPKVVAVFNDFLGTDQYIILEKNGPNAFQDFPHVHFHIFPVHSESWEEIFNITPKPFDADELHNEVATFRDYFLQAKLSIK